MKVSGSKKDLEERIIYYLDTKKSLDNKTSNSISKKEDFKKIDLDTKIGENFKCSETKREFFENNK